MPTAHGFELVREEEIAEYKSLARVYRHVKTGARLVSVINDDENKAFAITFPTPPADSTGIAHILEHSVLCGSRKYPLKEPFIELVKGSFNTFLNAMTGSAETYYPVASTNTRDFYNLVDVYLDAVFFPRLTPQVLEQEGWHYELTEKSQPLVYKGVVFNEMKGAYQKPDTVLFDYASRSLFPDHVYGFSSGGDPSKIPDLTFEGLSAFHQAYYHPSNAYVWFWGDDDSEERLRVLDGYFSQFTARSIESDIPLAPAFGEARRLAQPFAVGAERGREPEKAMMSMNWVLTDQIDAEIDLSLEMLQYLLTGTPASALRKALIDSGLVQEVIGSLQHERQRTFLIGMKGIDAVSEHTIESLVFDTLRKLAENGIPKEAVAAALNSQEFQLREANTGGFPRGLAIAFSALSTWLYGGDPLAPVRFEGPVATIRKAADAGGYFEGLIRSHLIANEHRTQIVYAPDAELAEREASDERRRLAVAREALNDEGLDRAIEETLALERHQQTPDPPETLRLLPRLSLSDLDRQVKTVPTDKRQVAGCPGHYHDLFTNGVVYLDLGFDLRTLPQELLPYIPLFSRALLQMGTEKEDFVALTQRIDSSTGGIWTENVVSSAFDQPDPVARLFLRAKATPAHAQELLDILKDILLSTRLDNPERFGQMVLEEKARLEARVSDAISFAGARLSARFSQAGWAGEQMSGVSYLGFVRSLPERVTGDWPGVLGALEQIRARLMTRPALVVNATVDESAYRDFEPHLADLVAALSETAGKPASWQTGQAHGPEAFTIAGQVGSVGKAASLARAAFTEGSAQVAAKLLRTSWLWDKIRLEGGAYGARCGFDYLAGTFTFLSYRDPNLARTIDIYDRAGEFLRNLDLSEAELSRTIIGTISEMDTYQLPDAKGFRAMVRSLTGDNDMRRQRRREEILGTTLADLRTFGEVLSEKVPEGHVCIVGSAPTIEKANAERPGWLTVTGLT